MTTIILNTIIQLIVFSTIPFIYYLFNRKNESSFLSFLGLKRCNKKYLLFALLCAFCISTISSILYYFYLKQSNQLFFQMELNKIIDVSLSSITITISTIFIYSYLKTGLAEELFFRGFVAKLIRKKINFKIANLIQSIIFAMIHVALILTITQELSIVIFAFILPFLSSLIGFYLNEINPEKSILPSIILHGTSNLLFFIVVYISTL